MSVALITEGTYPCYMGGVSVWSDQLLAGLTEQTFDVVSLQATGREPRIWSVPSSVRAVHVLPLWADPVSRTRRPVARARVREAVEAHDTLLRCLVRPDPWMRHWPPALLEDFRRSLRTLAAYAHDADLSRLLRGRGATDRILSLWRRPDLSGTLARRPPPPLSLDDALVITDVLEHLLRPLSWEPIAADVYHATANGLSALVALAAKWRLGVPFVLSEHGIYLRERYLEYATTRASQSVKTTLLNFFQLLCSVAYTEAAIIVPAADYNRRWELLNGAPAASIRTVHTGVAPERFPLAERDPKQPTIVYLGRIDPLKDIETLIEAFARVHAVMPAARLRIFGPVPPGNEAYAARCGALVHELGLDAHVTFEGSVATAVEAFHAGHVVALSSISEGFPYTVIEAMASGRATVSTLVGGVPEAIGDAGLGVPPRDPAALAGACIELLTNPKRRKAMGRSARARVLERFTLTRMLDAYRAIYKEATASRSIPSQGLEDEADEGASKEEAA